MIKNLRNKFVIVTTSLMIIVFGGFLLVNTLYNNYWNEIDIVDMLEWISDSGIFSYGSDGVNEKWVEGFAETNKPVIGIVMDKDFNPIQKQVLGDNDEVIISNDMLKSMCERKDKTNRIGRFYFSYSEPDTEHILLVVMDSAANEKIHIKVLGGIGIAVISISLLIIVTLYLSRFVTGPAELSMMREKRFISDASHELKTPLGAISVNAQAIKLSGEDNLYINNIISEAERMNRLIEKLLTLSRLDEEPEMVCEIINLSELCEEMSLTYESAAFEKKITFGYEIKDSLYIRGNADEIRQLMAILLDNAIKNTQELGQIEVVVDERRRRKVIEVKNTGKGIGEEELPHLFDRFYTLNQARDNNSFGLGLAIAKSIVERHKGVIEVDSVINEKTCFTIQF